LPELSNGIPVVSAGSFRHILVEEVMDVSLTYLGRVFNLAGIVEGIDAFEGSFSGGFAAFGGPAVELVLIFSG